MSFVGWANLYICANILLALAVVLLAAVDAIGGRLRHPLAYRHRLSLGRVAAVAAVLLPLVALLARHEHGLPRTAQVWSAPTMRFPATGPFEEGRLSVSSTPGGVSIPLDDAGKAAAALILIGLIVLLGKVCLDARASMRVVADAQTIRRRGRFSIRSSEQIRVPFSFWWPGRYFIVVPAALVLHPSDLKMSIRHEAQHHRQQDTKWLYVYQILKALFFWNPAVHQLEKRLRALQELACDEALGMEKNIVAFEYCRCLLRIAEAAALERNVLFRTSMIGDGEAFFLKRRIEAMLLRPSRHQPKRVVAVIGVFALAALAVAAVAFRSIIHDRRVTAEEAAAMAAVARTSTTVPLAVNERVLRQLNLLLATPDGRAYVKAGLERMRSYEALISAELARNGLPRELLVVPLVESGYRNLPPGDSARHGAGVWMFIEPTARRFGLTVDAGRDERLDVTAQTRAAAQYLASLHRHFDDWGLAILAYNAGAARVDEGIRRTGSRDVWHLIGEGYENDSDYLARVTAAILVMTNLSMLD